MSTLTQAFEGRLGEDAGIPRGITRAARVGLLRCHACGWTCAGTAGMDVPSQPHKCPRCRVVLRARKPASVSHTWAWLIAAAVLYIPANVLPIMHTQTLLISTDSTLLSGIAQLWNGGAWDLALIVFVASIAVPLIKILCLAFLLIGVQRRSSWHPRTRTRLYRIVDFIGHWSMLDIFVVSLLAALVQLGGVAEVRPEAGAVAFAAVVILTMIASMSFDARLIWDSVDDAASAADPGHANGMTSAASAQGLTETRP